MQPHEQRVIDEKQELDIKIGKLTEFIANSPTFRTLPEEDQSLLNFQHSVMGQYSTILGQRIERFK